MTGCDVSCSVVFGTLVGVSVFSVMWSELPITVYSVYVRVNCFVARGCAVSRWYIHVRNSDSMGIS